ncbi:GAF domain-containing sensor histidine kinase [Litorisediminicola beolgyonensis]|uniref:histidine kinase n=1 Tax=Litorisediminicola beolgyonensis TaxID=1173614 RepID=A0ABW3ZEE1_9RHOB
MRTYPIPFNEEARLRAVFDVPGLVSANDAIFDAICDATRKLFGCPIAHVSVIEDDTQWYKSVVGIELDRMPKAQSFCTYTIMSDAPMVVPDLSRDPRFTRHPMVAEGGPQARFYAGVPLILSSGYRFGSLCALDFVPHEPPSAREIAILTDLGRAVVAALEAIPPETAAAREDLQAKEAFLTLVGHELRTPLSILFGGMRLLEAQSAGTPGAVLVASARKSVEHLMRLVETLIAFSDASTGELRLNERAVNLQEILDRVSGLRLPAPNGTLKPVELQGAAGVGPLFVDPEQIELALTALLLNATLHGGDAIRIEVGRDGDGNVEISVVDTGRFEDHVDLAALYEPFMVGGDLKKRDTRGGLGLGLPLTRKLVELHGGEFEVRPGADGTAAVLRLPVWRSEQVH